MRKSILFVRPDYHCSFFYRDELRKLDWKADVYVPGSYPQKLLYSNNGTLKPFRLNDKISFFRWFDRVFVIIWYLGHFWRYKYHFYYGRPLVFSFLENKFGLQRLFGKTFLFSLWLAKLFGCKIIYLPTGCHDIESQENFSKLDDGNVCNNCGFFEKCDEKINNENFDRIRRFTDMVIWDGSHNSSQFSVTHRKYKSIDLQLWNPNLDIPIEHCLPPTQNLRILHSFYSEGRNYKGRNIKGSAYVLNAIERLCLEGHAVEYIYFDDKPSNQMRFYQAQADIIVEQLIYGWWGSTGVETMALGKPVVCYLRPSWKENFLKTFPEYDELPIVEANITTIYDVLKRLVTEHEYRRQMGEKSRKFAVQHFDPKKNAKSLEEFLLKL